jgi:hypothetical protein
MTNIQLLGRLSFLYLDLFLQKTSRITRFFNALEISANAHTISIMSTDHHESLLSPFSKTMQSFQDDSTCIKIQAMTADDMGFIRTGDEAI